MSLNGMHCKAGVDREPLEPCSQTELSWPLTPTCPGSVGSTRIMLTREEEYKKEYIKKKVYRIHSSFSNKFVFLDTEFTS